MSCQVCHSWACTCPPPFPDLDSALRIAQLEAALTDALAEIRSPGYLRNAGKQSAPDEWARLLATK
jgi:hypothetical protein